MSALDQSGLEVLDRTECLRLLSTARYGRVVYTVDGLPAVQPVKFTVRDDTVWFQTAVRSALSRAADGGVVAFEADVLSEEAAWWVTVLGRAMTTLSLPGPDLSWRPSPAVRELRVGVSIEVVSGRRFVG